MMILYTLLVFLLGAVHLLIQRKATALAKKYAQAAQQTEKVLRETAMKEGNSSRTDPYQVAKRSYLLGCLVEKKERLEARHFAWQACAERIGRFAKRVRDWQGKILPYAVGAVDVLVGLGLIEVFHLESTVGLTQAKAWLAGWLVG